MLQNFSQTQGTVFHSSACISSSEGFFKNRSAHFCGKSPSSGACPSQIAILFSLGLKFLMKWKPTYIYGDLNFSDSQQVFANLFSWRKLEGSLIISWKFQGRTPQEIWITAIFPARSKVVSYDVLHHRASAAFTGVPGSIPSWGACDFFRFCQSFTSNFPFPFSFPFLFLSLSFSLRPFVCAKKTHLRLYPINYSFSPCVMHNGDRDGSPERSGLVSCGHWMMPMLWSGGRADKISNKLAGDIACLGGSMVEHQRRLLGSRVRFPAGAFAIFPFLPKLHFQFPFPFLLSLSPFPPLPFPFLLPSTFRLR